MSPRPTTVRLALCAGLVALMGCDPCEDLEEQICEDLGPEDCAIWKAPPVDKSGIGSDRMTSESCSNAKSGPTYDRLLAAARSAVASKRALDRVREMKKKFQTDGGHP